MKDLILKTPELQDIKKTKAEQIKNAFEPMVAMLTRLELAFNKIVKEAEIEITHEVIVNARKVRLEMADVRHKTEKNRKMRKEEPLREGKAIDGVANVLKWAILGKERKLKEIEDHYEIERLKKIEKLQLERVQQLCEFVEDAEDRDLGTMDDDVWVAYLGVKKQAYNDKIAAEKKAEEERIAKEAAEKKEFDRVFEENKKIKAKAEALEREYRRREKIEAKIYEQKIKEHALKEEKRRANMEREEAEKQKLIAIEKAKVDELKAKLKAKEDAERKAEEERLAKIELKAKQGDEGSIDDLVNDLLRLKTAYTFNSNENKSMYLDFGILIDKLIRYVKNKKL